MGTKVERTIFETPRTSEYFDAKELTAQTGQPWTNFATVLLKELVDNALDAAETAGRAPEITIRTSRTDEALFVAVADNGPGISPETVRRILNFSTRASDKAAYRSPTRGAQGNALKTVIGIPHATGSDVPVIIAARGTRHTIAPQIDPTGDLVINPEEQPDEREVGTIVAATIRAYEQRFDPRHWARAFSLFNPHALVKISVTDHPSVHANCGDADDPELYNPTVAFPKPWSKHLPNDPTSPHWYDEKALKRLIFHHIKAARNGERELDLPIGKFIRMFAGLTATAKAKAVSEHFQGIKRLSDFEKNDVAVGTLLFLMKKHAEPIKPQKLGMVGGKHFRSRFDDWFGIKNDRFWYAPFGDVVNGIPFFIEVAVAETATPGRLFHAVNFSPTFGDPLAEIWLAGHEIRTYGVAAFLSQAHADPNFHHNGMPHITAAVHLVCPALDFGDRGKTRLVNVPSHMSNVIGETLWKATKTLYREGTQREKDATRAERAARNREVEAREKHISQKEAVFLVLPEAVKHATGDGEYPVSARTLYYAVRPLIQQHTPKALDYVYFSQTLLQDYQRQHGAISHLYYDPKGEMHEPHGDRQPLRLGTREVEGFEFPTWVYNKILYVEKKGLLPTLQAAQLGERYDMAIIAAEGYACEAARRLLQRADQGQQYRIFVLHDADPHGYNIARTLRDETDRMPGYHVEVCDLGLLLEEALELGLEPETFNRTKSLPTNLKLTDTEREYFEGRTLGSKQWRCRRVELNAFTAPNLVAFIERKLKENNADEKVIPPDDMIEWKYRDLLAKRIEDAVSYTVDQLLKTDQIKRKVFSQIKKPSAVPSALRQTVSDFLAANRERPWGDAIRRQISLPEGMSDDITEAVRQHIRAMIDRQAQDEDE